MEAAESVTRGGGWLGTGETRRRDGSRPTSGQEGDWHFHGWLLHDHAGNSVTVGKRAR